jgi:hypothetical protein
MTINFDALLIGDSLKKWQHDQKNPEVRLKGLYMELADGNVVTRGKKEVNGKETEAGVFWNGRLIIPSTLIHPSASIRLEAIRCIVDRSGNRKEGEFYNDKLIRGSIIYPDTSTFSGIFDEQERLVEGIITPYRPYYELSYHGKFTYGQIRGKPVTQCNGTKIHTVSKYREEGTFLIGMAPEIVTRKDSQGRIITGRIEFADYWVKGVLTHSPKGNNILCEGYKAGPNLSYMATGVFINGTPLKGVIVYSGNIEENVEDQIKGNEELLEDFMAQDEMQDYHAFCEKQRSIPPFRLQLDE